MKIAYISSNYPKDFLGGVEIVVAKEIEYMKKMGHDVIFIGKSIKGNEFDCFEDSELGRVYLIPTLNIKPTNNKIKNIFYIIKSVIDPVSLKYLENIFKKERPDIIHFHYLRDISFFAIKIAKRYSRNIFYTSHEYSLVCPKGGLLKSNGSECIKPRFICLLWSMIIKKIMRSVNILAVSNFMLDYMLKNNIDKDKITLLYNGVENLNINIEKKLKWLRSKTILFVGRLEKSKGCEILIKAFNSMKSSNSRLIIIGDGRQKENLKKLAMGNERIVFKDYIKHKKLIKYYDISSVVVVPSIWPESFNLVVVEAFSRGSPVVASNIGALKELIEDGKNGYLFEPGNYIELKNKLEKILCDFSLLTNICYENIKKAANFSWERHSIELEKIYKRLLSQ
jgi:glycosyltransferase involved in cell wall biosynthesis